MCGIVGMLVRDGLTDDDVAEVDALSELMVRRGPDDSGAWTDRSACALGFRRLSIIDLGPGGHQPMVTEDGEHVLVFNGEVYNYRDWARQFDSDVIPVTVPEPGWLVPAMVTSVVRDGVKRDA